jgi:hypothetical protein
MSHVSDGTSNTILVVETVDDRAVIWTKPDDLNIGDINPDRDLARRPPGGFLAAFVDGSAQFIRTDIDQPAFAALFTRAGREPADWRRFQLPPPTPPRRSFAGFPAEAVQKLGLKELLIDGIGNQVGFHVYDSEPMFDLNMSRFLGMAVGSFRPGRNFNEEILGAAAIVGSLNSPVYISVPVQNERIVDEFLTRLDSYLAELARRPPEGFIFSVEQDYYQLPTSDDHPGIRGYGLRFGPVKWRFFWARIGQAVYVASKQEILTDLLAIQSRGDEAPGNAGPAAHAMVRVRPRNWNRVLPHYQLGWEENNRVACLNNLGPLSSLTRALTAGKPERGASLTDEDFQDMTARLCDTHYFCPDGGHYDLAPDGKSVICTAHGSAKSPRQPASPNEDSEVGRLMREFADMRVALSFLEDGLHAVVTIERVPKK